MNHITEELFNTMMQFGKMISQKTHDSPEEKTATMLQLFALKNVKETPNITVTELGESLRLSKSSATQLTERLVKMEFLKRVDDKNDRRIIHLVITINGIEEFTNLKKKLMEKAESIFSHLDEKDMKELIRIYKKLLVKLNNKHT